MINVCVKEKGFFVECGALDGERSSNTNFIESKYKWTGLLACYVWVLIRFNLEFRKIKWRLDVIASFDVIL